MGRLRFRAGSAAVLTVLLVVACVGNDPTAVPPDRGTNDTKEDAGASTNGAFTLLDPPPRVVVGPSESVKIPIGIERIGGFDGAVEVTLQPLPDGTAAAPLVIPAGASTGELSLVATPNAAQAFGTVQVIATAQPSLIAKKDLSVFVRGAAGDRDVTFGDKSGTVLIGGIVPRATARMNDDGIVVLGEGKAGHGVGRVLPNGKLDPSFGTDGVKSLDGSSGNYTHLLVQKDGKLLAAGRSDDYKTLYIHRLTPAGAYDTGFGTNGIASVALTNGFFGIAVDDAERIVVGSFPATFRRLTPDGKPDTSFDETLSTGSEGWSKLLVRGSTPIAVGFSSVDTDSTAVGVSLITSKTSKVEHQYGGAKTVDVWSATVDHEGRVLVVGDFTNDPSAGSDAYVLRAKATGEFDDSFGFGGPATERFGSATEHSSFNTVLEEPSGKVLCVGQNATAGAQIPVLARYDTNGKRDLSFGDQGIVKETAARGTDHGGAALQTSLPTVVVARRYDPDSTVLLRYWR